MTAPELIAETLARCESLKAIHRKRRDYVEGWIDALTYLRNELKEKKQ